MWRSLWLSAALLTSVVAVPAAEPPRMAWTLGQADGAGRLAAAPSRLPADESWLRCPYRETRLYAELDAAEMRCWLVVGDRDNLPSTRNVFKLARTADGPALRAVQRVDSWQRLWRHTAGPLYRPAVWPETVPLPAALSELYADVALLPTAPTPDAALVVMLAVYDPRVERAALVRVRLLLGDLTAEAADGKRD